MKKSIGSDIREARLKAGLSLRQFCLKYNLDPLTVSKLERGLTEEAMSEKELVKKLPVVFRTSDGQNLSVEKLYGLAETIRILG